MITIAPPVVQPSLGLIALMHGVAKPNKKGITASGYGRGFFPHTQLWETVRNTGCKPLQEMGASNFLCTLSGPKSYWGKL